MGRRRLRQLSFQTDAQPTQMPRGGPGAPANTDTVPSTPAPFLQSVRSLFGSSASALAAGALTASGSWSQRSSRMTRSSPAGRGRRASASSGICCSARARNSRSSGWRSSRSHEMRLDHPRASCARFASISLSTLVSDTAAHDLASVRRTSWKCQTATATPAEPGELPLH